VYDKMELKLNEISEIVCIFKVILILTDLSADSKCIYLPLQLLVYNLSFVTELFSVEGVEWNVCSIEGIISEEC
jgi:hypothetical protein